MKGYDPVKVQREHLAKLVGATIVSVDAQADQFNQMDAWPLLNITLANGRPATLLIQQDPEGNGPGHVEVIE